MKKIKGVNKLVINWDKKTSYPKIFQIKILKELIQTLDPSQTFQYQKLDNFKKKAWDKQRSYLFNYLNYPEETQDLTLISDRYGIIDIFFNRAIPITETLKDYLASCTFIICPRDKNEFLAITTEFDFSNAKLRKRFTGYKYLRGDFKKYCVTSSKLNKKDQSLVINNKFKLFQGKKEISKFRAKLRENL